MGLLETVLVAEALCRKNSSMGIALALADIFVECLCLFGSEEQKQHYLPPICEGRQLCGISLAELDPDPGASAPLCRTATHGQDLEINGNRSLVVNAPAAGLYFVLCREADDPAPEGSFSLMLIPRPNEAAALQTVKGKLGMRLTTMGELRLHRLHVPAANRLGDKGKGTAQLRAATPSFHVKAAGMALGIAQGALDRSLNYARQRIQFRKKIGQFQVTRHKLAQMVLQVEQARCLTYTAAGRMDAGCPDYLPAAAARLSACEAAVQTAYEAIQLHGGYGYMTEYEVERFYRDAKMLQIAGGNSARLKDDISDLIIGKIT